ncbi:T9SS type A sorting domain-containing protein, partial [Saprospiraceae bacterium]|nr:T9SS type A sorting domain-containing protein [Saprospiraceae bacterium]
LTLSIDLVANATCANSSDGSATVIISGGEAPYDIIWENGETTETATMLPVGNTFAVVTDAAGFSAEAEIIINYILELEIDIVDLNNASCFGTPDGSISLSVPNGTEPINYEWSNGETGNTITNIFSGTYTVIATDANGCDATLDILITEPDELEVNQTMDMPSCNGDEDGFIILSVTGGISPFSFSWEDGSQNESNFNLTAGTYLTTITDFNECITVISTELTEPLALNLDSTIIEHPVCNGDTNGTITVTPMGGISGYDYSWSNGSTTQTISGLSEGEYMLTVTDSENCSQSETYTLLNQIELIISTSSTAESSPGASDGTATVEIISGGITPYEYEWSTGDTTATANNLISGAYNVTVTDANGCSVDGMAIVSSGDCSLSTVVDILPVTCNGDNNGSVLVTVENAIAPVSFLWSDGSIIGNRSNLAADTYSLIVFDNAGCSDTVMNIIISEPLELNAQISTTPTTTNITSDGEIVITAGGGTGPYNIKLLDANGEEVAVNETGIFSNIPSGIYGALVIDDNGCDLTIDFIEVTFVTSTSDLFETYGILTYPNPVTHQLTVSVKEFASNLDISLRTIKGKLIWSDKGKSRVISIDLSDHTPGLYLLSVADQKHTTTRKISILH